MEEKKRRGRIKMGVIDELMEGTYEQMKIKAEDRVSW